MSAVPMGGAPGAGPVTRYEALFESVRSRRAAPELHKGLDKAATRFGLRVRFFESRFSVLKAEAELICAQAGELHNFSDAVLDDAVETVRETFMRGRQGREELRRALALVREVARRETGEEAYPVQVIGALALWHGRIAEMVTGEGKTLTGSLATPLLAWRHRRLHVFTVNDYLAARDAESRAPVLERCGLSVGAITQATQEQERYSIYARSVVYGTAKQITADYLRDQIRLGRAGTAWAGWRRTERTGAGPMVPGLRAAMVDEADAVLIDEGVVPLIIARSRHEDEMAPVYEAASRLAKKLDEGPDYEIDGLRRKATIKRRGKARLEGLFAELINEGGPGSRVWKAAMRAEELVRQGLIARHCYKRGQQYDIVDGQVVLIDEYTGRFLPDRNWEHGLHQAVEAKEGLEVTADRETLARLSFQRFFRSYRFLCGMTGTVAESAGEMETTYQRPMTAAPTNKPLAREKMPTRVFRTMDDKFREAAKSAALIRGRGRPVLIGTRSITASELVAQLLDEQGVECRVLNANFDADEAEVIADAGRAGVVTVATNMAGRGTDIKLDEAAREAGGLHVILTELHASSRIDRQFVGRAGRQGDPGSSQFFASFEDELVQLHAPGLVRTLRSGTTGKELSGRATARLLLAVAQRRAEGRSRRQRAQVLKQDDWIDKRLPGA